MCYLLFLILFQAFRGHFIYQFEYCLTFEVTIKLKKKDWEVSQHYFSNKHTQRGKY